MTVEDGPKEKPKLRVNMTKYQAVNSKKCIAFNDCLEKLLRAAVGTECNKCHADLIYNHVIRGSCLLIKWGCPSGKHQQGIWSSQPRLEGMYAGNLLIPTCLLFSGNNYAKVALMARFLNLGFVGQSNFYRLVLPL